MFLSMKVQFNIWPVYIAGLNHGVIILFVGPGAKNGLQVPFKSTAHSVTVFCTETQKPTSINTLEHYLVSTTGRYCSLVVQISK